MKRSVLRCARGLGTGLIPLLIAACSTLAGADEPRDLAILPLSPAESSAPTVITPPDPSAPMSTTITDLPIEPPPTEPASVPASACGGAPSMPGEALEIGELAADLDGDGSSDLLLTYAIPTADGLLRWRLRIELASGEASDVELPDAYGRVRPLGAIELDPASARIAGKEVVITVGQTEFTSILGFVGVDERGCGFRFGDGLGNPTGLPVGDADRRRAGLRCELVDGAQVMIELTAESDDGQNFTTYDARLQRVTTNLIPGPTEEGVATLDGPSLFAFSIVDCPGISL